MELNRAFDSTLAVLMKVESGQLNAPTPLDRTVRLPSGEFPGAGVMGLAATDQFAQGWDLTDGEAPFGPAVEPSAGVTPADQFAAFLGRSVTRAR